ncbi:bifunctional diguanylate cyclase/phosphodiesterase [Cereibacter sphaeroides]|uniref:bifunctional diguanylate cyclase/phosphodiesterase n=1 Tax=Cereibacter sphaeroides TaxID=1063 RepID=UPI001F163EF9|nr:bifunctional diguanylate cyclase/phosphodiesterase [Cereibacter sphaeroides]MCE6959184.1 bifunctional diguanylate cyclase/phosphodiesterase [Cereibacter sphaeroides]MCE6968426.1 bifunctional diguanylate cyclase/phosphodiesterase [Cereibacter sphaeroides]MCE6974155.1 bifunctional diguanylate cyclase/phosphodiesterase [Cereibacter sphaeroides]
MRKPRTSATFSSQLVAAILLACFVGTAAIFFLGHTAVRTVDEDAEARQRRFAVAALEADAAKLVSDQQVSTIWSEAVLRVRAADHPWMEANLGLWMHEFFGHDELYVVTPADHPLHVWRNGKTERPDVGATLPDPLVGLVRKMRQEMREKTTNPTSSTDDISGLSIQEHVLLGRQPALASVTPIVPDGPDVRQAAGSEFLHVAIQYADADMAGRLAAAYEFQDATFVLHPPAEASAAIPLTDALGSEIAWFAWTPDRPGLRLTRQMAPVIGLFALCGAGLLLWLLRRLWVASHRLHRSEEEARYLAFHDPLAGIPNRMLFEERLTQALKLEKRGGPPVALLCLDLDRFKAVNDTLGHPAGDELIRQMAARLRSYVRETDTVARLGGDEFGIILMGMGSDEALARYCSGLVHLLSAPYDLKSAQAHVSASIGAVRAADVEGGMEALMRSADAALYRAKGDGRARFGIFTPEMDAMFSRRHEIERDLRAAIAAGGQFHLLYQPIFDAENAVVGAEALVRWQHPTQGLLAPDVFIGIAEETGLINPLGRWVLEQACILAATAGLPKISVNVSPVQLRDELFGQQVLDVLAATGLPGRMLELELTERFTLDADRATTANLDQLRAAGISIALDDFGTGQSLLRYVRDYPIDTIKIDRSFVSRLGTGDGTDQVVRAIVDLSRAMGIEITAEGVENEAQRDLLLGMGCHVFQGFLLGRPMDPLRLAALTARKGTAQKRA